MVEPLDMIDLIDRLCAAIKQGRALEMAITGSCSLQKDEREALELLAEHFVDSIKALHRELDAQQSATDGREP